MQQMKDSEMQGLHGAKEQCKVQGAATKNVLENSTGRDPTVSEISARPRQLPRSGILALAGSLLKARCKKMQGDARRHSLRFEKPTWNQLADHMKPCNLLLWIL